MRYFLQFAYCGTEFHGSQSQPAGGTVQDVMEDAMATIFRSPIPLTFAGRTDAGVHAEMMYAHFDTPLLPDECAQRVYRLNRFLPPAIAIYNLFPVAPDAHARFDAISRTYHYRITTRKDPFQHALRTQVRSGLNYPLMNQAAHYLMGTQDFSSFCRTHTDVKTKICNITTAEWRIENDHEAVFVITADRFLRNMVRAIIGTLFEVGYAKITPTAFAHLITRQNRSLAGESAPAQGLYLTSIQYPSTISL